MYDRLIEPMPPERLRALQLERLRDVLARVEQRVPFYRAAWAPAGLTPGAASRLHALDDLARFPFTTRRDLREQYPTGLWAVPPAEVARLHATSGTRGKPTLVAYTRGDLACWAQVNARLLYAAGLRRGDALHVALGYGLFTGGLGIHAGAELLGVAVIPASSGGTQRQLTLLADLRPTAIKSTPSFALHLAESARQAGLDPRAFGLRVGIFGAEPWSEAMRTLLEEQFGLAAYDSYGLSEMLGPGVACECRERRGLHLAEDHFLPEIIDPATGQPLPPGAEGELVLTSLTKEALPLIRYRTGDRTAILPGPCPCGRTHRRIARIRGRVDEMLVLRGVNLFPSEVERVLLGFPALAPHYQFRVWRAGARDMAEVRVELRPDAARDAIDVPHSAPHDATDTAGRPPGDAGLAGALARALKAELGVSLQVQVGPPGSVPRPEGRNKALRVIDERER